MAQNELGTVKKIYCNTCKTLTNHELVFVHERDLDKEIKWDEPLPKL
jgi:hypothetical protein